MNIFSLIFSLWSQSESRRRKCFFFFFLSKSIKGLEWPIPEWLCWKVKNMCIVLLWFFGLTKILWSFFLFVKPIFSCGAILSIWSLLHLKKSPLFIGETRELNLESPIFSWLIQRIWLSLFLSWLQLEDLFPLKIYQRENIYLFIYLY